MAPQVFYVYELIDPRDGAVFYVGKGKGKRAYQHERDAARGAKGHRHNKIRAIASVGLKPEVRIVKNFKSEDAAYRFEARHIKAIGLHELTNVAPGGRGTGGAKDPDLAEIDLIALCARKTGGFRFRPQMRFAGQIFDIGDALTRVGHAQIDKMLKRRGRQWLTEKLAHRNIHLTLIENNGEINAV